MEKLCVIVHLACWVYACVSVLPMTSQQTTVLLDTAHTLVLQILTRLYIMCTWIRLHSETYAKHGRERDHFAQNVNLTIYTYYGMRCVECPHFQLKNILVMSLLPTTSLFILVTVFHLHVIHPPWSVFVLVAQAISVPFRNFIYTVNITSMKDHNQ